MEIILLHSAQVEASRAIAAQLGGEPADADVTINHDGRDVRVVSKHTLAVGLCPNFSAYPAIVVVEDGGAIRCKSPVASWAECLDFVDNPPAPPLQGDSTPRIVTQFEFSQLFTSDERKAIRAAAKVNPDIEDAVDVLGRAKEVDLDLVATRDGVNAMEAAGLLATGRAARILANLPPEVVEG